MTRAILISLVTFLFFSFSSEAQNLSYGVKAGLSFSNFQGPNEQDASGNEVENFELVTGFHVGGGVNAKFTDLFGLRAELLYSQKGVQYNFNGPSYWIFNDTDRERIYSTGQRSMIMEITNSYLDLPVMAFVRLGRIELSAGVSAGILVASQAAGGELIYSGTTTDGISVDEFTLTLDYSYLSDDFERAPVEENHDISIGGEIVQVPKSIGAYYEYDGEGEKLFNSLDLGLNAGVSFFLNQGLYIGARLNYGLSDVTKEEGDFSRVKMENNQFITRPDKDQNLVMQLSVGFSF